MISVAALCPHPPLLFRELGGAADPVGELRAAALTAVRDLVAGARLVVVVGPHVEAGDWDADLQEDVRSFGTAGPSTPSPLPLSLGVGRRLLREASWSGPVELRTVSQRADDEEIDALAGDLAGRPEGTVLLLLGDGSARRGDTAPGYLDERAFPFDDEVARALAEGDAQALRDLATDLADELMVLGAPSFRVLGALAARQGMEPEASLHHRGDPFGVTYLVATWRLTA